MTKRDKQIQKKDCFCFCTVWWEKLLIEGEYVFVHPHRHTHKMAIVSFFLKRSFELRHLIKISCISHRDKKKDQRVPFRKVRRKLTFRVSCLTYCLNYSKYVRFDAHVLTIKTMHIREWFGFLRILRFLNWFSRLKYMKNNFVQ